MAESKNIIIYSLKMAGYLMQRGFVLFDVRDNLDGSGKKVFYFNHSPMIEEAMREYKNVQKSHKSANNS